MWTLKCQVVISKEKELVLPAGGPSASGMPECVRHGQWGCRQGLDLSKNTTSAPREELSGPRVLRPEDHPFLCEADNYQASAVLCGRPGLYPQTWLPLLGTQLNKVSLDFLRASPDLVRVSLGPSGPHCLFSFHSWCPSGNVLQPLCTACSSRLVRFTSSEVWSVLFFLPWRLFQTLYLTSSYWFLRIQLKVTCLEIPFSDSQSHS